MKAQIMTPEQAEAIQKAILSWPLKGIFAVGFDANGEPFFFSDGRLLPGSAAHALAFAEQVIRSAYFPELPMPVQAGQPIATPAGSGQKPH